MTSEREIERLERVYAGYAAAPEFGTRWGRGNRGNVLIEAERSSAIRTLLDSCGLWPPGDRNILDVGCGEGALLGEFLGWGAQPQNLAGIDLLPARIEAAIERFPGVAFTAGNAESLPFEAGAFDLVCSFTVFSSILDGDVSSNVATEMTRVLKPGGAVLLYDFRISSPSNRNTRGMPRKAIRHLFPGLRARFKSLTVLPPLVRRLGRITPRVYPALASLPFMRTHNLGVLMKNDA